MIRVFFSIPGLSFSVQYNLIINQGTTIMLHTPSIHAVAVIQDIRSTSRNLTILWTYATEAESITDLFVISVTYDETCAIPRVVVSVTNVTSRKYTITDLDESGRYTVCLATVLTSGTIIERNSIAYTVNSGERAFLFISYFRER